MVRSYLLGPHWLQFLHLIGLHLGLHLLPVLAHSAFLGSNPGVLLVGFAHSGNLAGSKLGHCWLDSLI